eukprot:9061274-Alexandrium_andersonii.AAC.1
MCYAPCCCPPRLQGRRSISCGLHVGFSHSGIQTTSGHWALAVACCLSVLTSQLFLLLQVARSSSDNLDPDAALFEPVTPVVARVDADREARPACGPYPGTPIDNVIVEMLRKLTSSSAS